MSYFAGMFLHNARPGWSDKLDENTPQVAIPGLMQSGKADTIIEDLYFCTIRPAKRRASTSDGYKSAPS